MTMKVAVTGDFNSLKPLFTEVLVSLEHTDATVLTAIVENVTMVQTFPMLGIKVTLLHGVRNDGTLFSVKLDNVATVLIA